MFIAAGVGAYQASIFHLLTHAFFKALLFLGAGSVIHAMHDEQDIHKMGGLASKIPLTAALMWIGSLALAGGATLRRVLIPRTPSSRPPGRPARGIGQVRFLVRHHRRRAPDRVLFVAACFHSHLPRPARGPITIPTEHAHESPP